MRLLKELIKNDGTVWIYCESEKFQEKFLKQAEAEGFIALNGDIPTKLFRHQLYGISDDMTMGYLSNMIWWLSLRTNKDKHIRVDYKKYISGDENYYWMASESKRIHYID